jgi:hypothetical protein
MQYWTSRASRDGDIEILEHLGQLNSWCVDDEVEHGLLQPLSLHIHRRVLGMLLQLSRCFFLDDVGMPYQVLNIVVPGTEPRKEQKKSHEEIHMKPKILR